MRINDLVSQSLGIPVNQTYGVRQRKDASPLAAASDGGAQQRQRVATPRINFLASPQQQQQAVATRGSDQAQFSDEAYDLADTGDGSTDGTGGSGQSGENVLGAIVDQYVRQRMTMTYSVPIRTANGMGSFTISYDVEQAYRVTKILGPGQLVDAQG